MTGKNINYKYDFAGRRVLKSRFNPQPSITIKFSYDGDQIIADYNNTGVLQRKYIYGPGIDEPICMLDVQNGNAVYYYHFDGLGSVIALSDSSGNVVEKYRYDVFGRPEIRDTNDAILTTSAFGNRYMFTGREYDSETGLYYYRARYYHPTLGRFMQIDPFSYINGINLYTYVKNNPLSYIDPAGLSCYEIKMSLTSFTLHGSWTTGFCVPFTELLLPGIIKMVVNASFPIEKSENTCPKCQHCEWGKPWEGTMEIELMDFNRRFGTCTIHAHISLNTSVDMRFGSCKKDESSECCP